jgi:hypothetical protein
MNAGYSPSTWRRNRGTLNKAGNSHSNWRKKQGDVKVGAAGVARSVALVRTLRQIALPTVRFEALRWERRNLPQRRRHPPQPVRGAQPWPLQCSTREFLALSSPPAGLLWPMPLLATVNDQLRRVSPLDTEIVGGELRRDIAGGVAHQVNGCL